MIKLLVVSDTHGRHGNLEYVIEKEKPFDMMLHLGDVDRRENEIYEMADCEVKIVSGNNDYFSRLPQDCDFVVGNKRIFMNHGHMHYVDWGTDRIRSEGKKRKADIVLFGHIHVPVLENIAGMTVMCPGSIAYPRQNKIGASYGIIEMDDNGTITSEIRAV